MTDTPPAQRIALCVEYNGRDYNGWQAQKSPTAITVQEVLEQALAAVADHPVKLFCAGRTDAGVHACGQIVHFDTASSRPESAWVRGANSLVPPSVSVRWACRVKPEFHARFSAVSRCYRYVIFNHPVRPAILQGLVTPHYNALDAAEMDQAGQALLGENDFTSFRGAACQSSTPMRNVTRLRVARAGDFVMMEIEANAFLLHMVRNIAGVLMEIGEGKKPRQWAAQVLDAKDRTLGGITAPATGLYLARVSYPDHFGLPETAAGPAIWDFIAGR